MSNCSKREIYQFEMRNKRYLLDVTTSRVFSIDDLTSEVLDLVDSHSKKEIIDILAPKFGKAEVNAILDELQRVSIVGKEVEPEDPLPAFPISKITCLNLQVSRECNLRCKYCYTKWGSFGGEKGFMNKDVAKKAIDFLMRESGESEICRINFDGGEPLLNFELIKYVVVEATKQDQRLGKKVVFGINTNGTLLSDRIVNFLNENRVGVNVSLDGPKGIHDSLRVFKNGDGSYDRIIPGLRRLLKASKGEVGCSLVVTKHSLSYLREIVNDLYGLGFSSISLAFVRGNGEEWAVNEEDLPKIREQYEKLALFCLDRFFERGEIGLTNLYLRLKSIYFRSHRLMACGAGNNYVAISPSGTIYPCHSLVGIPEFVIGNLASGLENRRRQNFFKNGIQSKPDCRKCWARYFCGGGCAYDAVLANGDILKPDLFRCSITKEEVKLGIMLYSEINKKDTAILERIFEGRKKRESRGREEEKDSLEAQSLC